MVLLLLIEEEFEFFTSFNNIKESDIPFFFNYFFLGPICNFLSAVISTTILINACHYCTVQVILYYGNLLCFCI